MLSVPVLTPKYSLKVLESVLALIIGILTIKGTSLNAIAQTPSSNSPLTVRADIQEANSETGVVTARGNVQIFIPPAKFKELQPKHNILVENVVWF